MVDVYIVTLSTDESASSVTGGPATFGPLRSINRRKIQGESI